jgi:hypothetical protein
MDIPVDLIHVFDHDPELLVGLDGRTAAHLRQRLVARRRMAEPGSWRYELAEAEAVGHFGLLVVDGLLVRTVSLGQRESSEVVGPGDLIRPWEGDDPRLSVSSCSEWRVLVPTTFAELDARFARQAAPYPSIAAQLLGRSTMRCRALVHQATIAHVRHASSRVLLALWHLADRWGRVTSEGVLVPVPMTHQLVAQITCLQRPTVSAAVSRLTQAGDVSRAAAGGWLLHGEPPTSADVGARIAAA